MGGINSKNTGNGANMSDAINTREPLCMEPKSNGKCSNEGEDCLRSKCCMHPLKHCYQKNAYFATCKVTCMKGINDADPEGYRTPWECKRVGKPMFSESITKPSMHCFSLVQESGSELELSRELFKRDLHIFSCDSWTLYSGIDVVLGTKGEIVHKARAIPGGIKADVGGMYMTLSNTEIFLKVWKAVFDDGKIWDADWTTKIDSDTVFLPERVRFHLTTKNPLDAIYFNNCKYGNHGPMEIISKAGMAAFSAGMETCIWRFKGEFNLFGEDVFVRHCLRSLAVPQHDNFNLLSEEHCDENPSPCVSGKAAFHPFKNWTHHSKCLEESGEAPWHRNTPML